MGDLCEYPPLSKKSQWQAPRLYSTPLEVWLLIFKASSPWTNYLLSIVSKDTRKCIRKLGSDPTVGCFFDRLILNITSQATKPTFDSIYFYEVRLSQLLATTICSYFGINNFATREYDFLRVFRCSIGGIKSFFIDKSQIRSIFYDIPVDLKRTNETTTENVLYPVTNLLEGISHIIPDKFLTYSIDSIGFELPDRSIESIITQSIDRDNPTLYRLYVMISGRTFNSTMIAERDTLKIVSSCLFDWEVHILTQTAWRILETPIIFEKVIKPTLKIDDCSK